MTLLLKCQASLFPSELDQPRTKPCRQKSRRYQLHCESCPFATQMVAREPQLLLLLRDPPTVANRLHSLLDLFPHLGRGDSARLRKAACLLLQPRDMIEAKVVGIAKLLPREVDVRASSDRVIDHLSLLISSSYFSFLCVPSCAENLSR